MSQMKQGDVRIVVGRVVASSPPLVSPLSQEACVLYKITIEALDGDWHIVASEKQSQNFFFVDIWGEPVQGA